MDSLFEYNLLPLDVYKKVFGDMNLKCLDGCGTSVLVLASVGTTLKTWAGANNELN